MNIDQIYIFKTSMLLDKMMRNNDFSYDVYFRMAVIDEYLKQNEKIWNLYYDMQLTRANQVSFVSKHMINHKEEFIKLINSIKTNGFNYNNPILVNNQYMVIDGAHRMACSLYFDIKDISIKTTDKFINFIPNEYTKKWFENNNLKECIPYAEKQKAIVKKMMKNV